MLLIFIITRLECSFNESISDLRDILENIESKTLFLRKYLNLMLSIYNLKINDKRYTHARKMCSFIIINFLRYKNILPNEETMFALKEFISISNDEEFNKDESIVDYDNFNLFLRFHVCRCGAKKPDHFIKIIENSNFDGDIYLDCQHCGIKEERTCLVFMFDSEYEQYSSEIFSPLKLFNFTNIIFAEFTDHFNYDLLDKSLLRKIIINLIFYCKNTGVTYKFLLKFLLLF